MTATVRCRMYFSSTLCQENSAFTMNVNVKYNNIVFSE